MKTNKVYLVGAGPGDPGLITVKGLGILGQADVVVYDYLVDKRLLEYAPPGAELICCDTPPHQLSKKNMDKPSWCGGKLGKKRYMDGFGINQERIHNLIVKEAKRGKKVVRLKNGDPAIFSRLSQELEALVKNKIEFEVVPGVTAASAASCLSGIPLTDRRLASSCVFVTGHEDPEKKKSAIDWQSLSKSGTIILYMAVENLKAIVTELLKAGKAKNTPCAVIQETGLLTQKVVTSSLKNIAAEARKEKIRPPAIIIIGQVARFEKRFNWLRRDRKILFTGLSKERFFEQGTYFHLPLIKIKPLEDYAEFDGYLRKITGFDWIVFTSRYAAEYFFARLKAIGCDARILQGINIAAIGNSTKTRLRDLGVLADLVPGKESSQGLLEEFKKLDLKDRKVFLPRSDISDKGLTQGLQDLGAEVIASAAYRNVKPEYLPDLDFHSFDRIMFTSPSGVRNFVKRYGALPETVKVSCIGEVTYKEAKKWRLAD